MVIVAVQAPQVVSIAQRCADIGVGTLLVFTAGFGEGDGTGHEMLDSLRDVVESSALRVLGPNCVGNVNLFDNVVTTFGRLPANLVAGPLGIVSQSGGVGLTILKYAHRFALDAGYLLTTGDQVDVTATEMCQVLVKDERVTVLVAFLEALPNPEEFIQLTFECRDAGKPLIVLVGGSSDVGAKASISHTGAMLGSSSLFESLCRQEGVLYASSIRQAVNWARALSCSKRLSGARMGIVSGSGGMGIIATDAARSKGLEVPDLGEVQKQELKDIVPAFGSIRNPVDLTPQIGGDPLIFGRVIQTVLKSDNLDGVFVCGIPDEYNQGIATALTEASKVTAKALAAWGLSPGWIEELRHTDVLIYEDPLEAMESFAEVVKFLDGQRTFDRAVASFPDSDEDLVHQVDALLGSHREVLSEFDAKRVMSIYGLEIPKEGVARDLKETQRLSNLFGGSLAMKLVGSEFAHRSDIGGVILGVRGPADVESAYQELIEVSKNVGIENPSILVQEMGPRGTELALGVVRDPLGLFVSIAIGGTLVETISRKEVLRAPFSEERALRHVRQLFGSNNAVVRAGVTNAGVTVLAKTMCLVAQMAHNHQRIVSLEINPVIVTGTKLFLADALIVMDQD
jgi:acyl-CoA synthetase (NDP forming)